MPRTSLPSSVLQGAVLGTEAVCVRWIWLAIGIVIGAAAI